MSAAQRPVGKGLQYHILQNSTLSELLMSREGGGRRFEPENCQNKISMREKKELKKSFINKKFYMFKKGTQFILDCLVLGLTKEQNPAPNHYTAWPLLK